MDLIPVYVGSRIVEMADPCRVFVLCCARNVQVVRARKTHMITQINLLSWIDDSALPEAGPREDSRVSTYAETLEPAPIVMLKIIGADGSMRRWNRRDRFDPRRFNPDVTPGLCL